MLYSKELETLKLKNRLRQREIYSDSTIDLASNDYLGFAKDKKLLSKTFKELKTLQTHSPTASMLVNGYSKAHLEFEEILLKYNKFESAIILGSGFLANLALFETLPRGQDLLIIDEEYHASGILSAKLAKNVKFFKHNDFNDLENILIKNVQKNRQTNGDKRIFVAVEGVYSMSGELCPKEIFDICDKFNVVLIVDEAHSVGVIGDNLLGIFEFYGITPKQNHIKMGTLGKALGSYGAYILSSKEIGEFLINRSKPIIYSTALSIFDTILAKNSFLKMVKDKKLKLKIEKRQKIFQQQLNIFSSSLIFTVPMKDNVSCLNIKNNLLKAGFLVGAIRPPTVKKPILRIIPNLNVSKKLLIKFIQELKNEL